MGTATLRPTGCRLHAAPSQMRSAHRIDFPNTESRNVQWQYSSGTSGTVFFFCLICLFLGTQLVNFSLDTKFSIVLPQCVFGFSKLVDM